VILTGRRIIIAGVGPGVGREMATTFGALGADLVLAARSRELITDVAAELVASGGRAVAQPTDLADPAQCRALADRAIGELGGVDGLVLNAFTRAPLGPLVDQPAAHWHDALQSNIVGALSLVSALAPALAASGHGSIVVVSSISARTPYPSSGIYAAVKAALHSVVRSLAIELGPRGITVNTLVPGYIEAPVLDLFFDAEAAARGGTGAEARARAEASAALGRFTTAAEVAGAAALLLSDLASGITGQSLDVNAGQHFN
jgi:NAD(P)-dependent dehydrogenase (short-subunit alcohol dehydrogenase family)